MSSWELIWTQGKADCRLATTILPTAPALGNVGLSTYASMKKKPSAEFLLISECVTRLERGMFGNAPRSLPVINAKKNKKLGRDLSVGFGPQREEAAALVRDAALSGKLPVYVRPRDGRAAKSQELKPVPPAILKLVVPARKGLPDHPIHARSPAGKLDDADMLPLVRHGQLVARLSDLEAWYEQQRARGPWPSQRGQNIPRGRRSKDVEQLRNAILALVHEEAWTASAGMPALRDKLIAGGHIPPSADTLARVVDRLFKLSGNPALRRRVRNPSGPCKP
jgi:hypothetical protein